MPMNSQTRRLVRFSNLKKIVLFIFLLIAVLSYPLNLLAETSKPPTVKDLIDQEAVDEKANLDVSVTKAVPQDKFDRSTPRSSVQALGKTLKERNYELALNYFDMRNLPGSLVNRGQTLARELKIVVEQSLWVDLDTVSDDPKGHQDDGLPAYRDIIARLKTPERSIDILMQRIPDGKGQYVWKVSNRTIADIPFLYKHFGYGEFGDKLSRMLPDYEFLGLAVWQWVMLLAILLAAYLISWFITKLANFILRKIKSNTSARLQSFISGPVRFLIFVLIVSGNLDLVSSSMAAKAIIEAETFLILAFAWLITGLLELAYGRLSDRLKCNGKEAAMVLLRPAATLIKIIIFLIAIMTWLDKLGFNVTAMLAGLGVGGIAVGLAAQKSIENLIGAITLYVAQPVKIGDFCRAGKTLGVVEEIGLRSTALRTLDRILVSIPNATFVNLDIENLSERDKMLFRHTIRLRNNTTPEQIRTILENVRKMFKAHADVDPEPARIRFTKYAEHSLHLEIFAYTNTSDFNEYLGIIEDLNLRILGIISDAGTELAFPAGMISMPKEGKAT